MTPHESDEQAYGLFIQEWTMYEPNSRMSFLAGRETLREELMEKAVFDSSQVKDFFFNTNFDTPTDDGLANFKAGFQLALEKLGLK